MRSECLMVRHLSTGVPHHLPARAPYAPHRHWHAAMGMQPWACSYEHAAMGMQLWACSYGHAAMGMQPWACNQGHVRPCACTDDHAYTPMRTRPPMRICPCAYAHAHTPMCICPCAYVHARPPMHTRPCAYAHAQVLPPVPQRPWGAIWE